MILVVILDWLLNLISIIHIEVLRVGGLDLVLRSNNRLEGLGLFSNSKFCDKILLLLNFNR